MKIFRRDKVKLHVYGNYRKMEFYYIILCHFELVRVGIVLLWVGFVVNRYNSLWGRLRAN